MILGLFAKNDVKTKIDNDFNNLCNATYNDLKKYVVRLMNGNVHSAEEVVQNTYKAATEQKELLLSHPNPPGWLFNTAKNICREQWRKTKKIYGYEEELTDNLYIKENQFNDEEDIFYDVLKEEVTSQLSERDIWLITEHCINEVSIREIAESYNENYDALQKHIYRLLKKIKNTLKNHDI